MKTLTTNARENLLMLILFMLCVIGNAQTIDEVRQEIDKQQILCPDIVLAQAVLETGWFKSYGCTHRKNLFGFYWKGEFKHWDTWQESVKYYSDWQRRHFKGGCYYEFLEEIGYASDSKYIEKLKSIKL